LRTSSLLVPPNRKCSRCHSGWAGRTCSFLSYDSVHGRFGLLREPFAVLPQRDNRQISPLDAEGVVFELKHYEFRMVLARQGHPAVDRFQAIPGHSAHDKDS
jgi:hypothetical protein